MNGPTAVLKRSSVSTAIRYTDLIIWLNLKTVLLSICNFFLVVYDQKCTNKTFKDSHGGKAVQMWHLLQGVSIFVNTNQFLLLFYSYF